MKTEKPLEEPEEIDPVNIEKSKPICNFLKRKSQTYKPTKLEWKAKSRINCWGEANSIEPKKKIIKKQIINQISFNRVQELESINAYISKKHITVDEYFGDQSRTHTYSKISQFTPDSFFITHFNNDMYHEIFEIYQNHYLKLCNEDDIQ